MAPHIESPPTMHRLVEKINQSAPIDLSKSYDPRTLSGKVILITGGAAGFGAAFAREWASHGAIIIAGDVNATAGQELMAELRKTTGNEHHAFIPCDVRSWQSQVDFFNEAVGSSPTGGLDVVVPNAGIREVKNCATDEGFENPRDLNTPSPSPPDLNIIDINLTGMLYTVHLALFHLPRNPSSNRTILLISSIAGTSPLPGQPLYSTSKHAVTGLFRSLRGTTWRQGIRLNMLCPYYADTDLMTGMGRVLLAGGALARVRDVVDAGTRLVADGDIRGRALVVGPRMRVVDVGGEDGEERAEESEGWGAGEAGRLRLAGMPRDGEGKAVWEIYAHDYESTELFTYRYMQLLNAVTVLRGWVGWLSDFLDAVMGRRVER